MSDAISDLPGTMPSAGRAAVIGLGSMGFGTALSLKRAGFEVTGCDVSAAAVERFVAEGGRGASTPAQAVIGADVVVSVVVNAAQTEAVLFGQEGVAEAMAKGSVFVSSSTMDPDMARRLAKRLEAKGCLYLGAGMGRDDDASVARLYGRVTRTPLPGDPTA